MRLKYHLIGLVLLSFNLSSAYSQERDSGELPRTWDTKQIEKDAPGSGGRFYVLAWTASESWESCLALRVIGKGESERWHLYHLYRQPSAKNAR